MGEDLHELEMEFHYSDANPEVLNTGRILKSIGELSKIPMLGSHPRPIKSETVKASMNIDTF